MLDAHRELVADTLRGLLGDLSDELLHQLLPRLEWIEVGGGEVLLEQGSTDDSLYLLVGGRLRATAVDAGGQRTTLGEIARGEAVGEMAFFTGQPRTATVVAVRDSLLVRVGRELFRDILVNDPTVALNLTRLVIQRLQRGATAAAAGPKPVVFGIAAITDNVDARNFAHALLRELQPQGRAVVIDAAWVDQRLGAGAASVAMQDGERSHRVALLLEQAESEHQFVLLVADAGPTGWSRRCLRQCDEVVLVADAEQPPALHRLETECVPQPGAERGQVRSTLVLLHPPHRRMPERTARWFAGRSVARHIHVRRELARDWGRLGRILGGNATGLVLSGGGARGFAHLGVLGALEEAGVGYDLVGGTSIGAVMGCHAALDVPADEAVRMAREAFRRNPTGDFNPVPLLSLIRGSRLKRLIGSAVAEACGADAGIEDLWKGFFCVSANYSTACEAVHERGPLARALRASVSIPGALPPVMIDGELHIDGGTFNNFPVDVMARRGVARVIGVNLLRDRNFRYPLDDVPGAMALVRDKLLGRRHRLPSLSSLMLNASMINSYARQRNAQAGVALYFAPEVHRFGMLDWSSFDRVVEAGRVHARQVLGGQLQPDTPEDNVALAQVPLPAPTS